MNVLIESYLSVSRSHPTIHPSTQENHCITVWFFKRSYRNQNITLVVQKWWPSAEAADFKYLKNSVVLPFLYTGGERRVKSSPYVFSVFSFFFHVYLLFGCRIVTLPLLPPNPSQGDSSIWNSPMMLSGGRISSNVRSSTEAEIVFHRTSVSARRPLSRWGTGFPL